ncbi:excalibur calcium-binding domain-containing protein [Streptosporangium sp. NPDC001682]
MTTTPDSCWAGPSNAPTATPRPCHTCAWPRPCPQSPTNNGVPDTTNPAGTDPAATNPPGTDPAATTPPGTDAAATNPVTRNTAPATSGDGDLDPKYRTCKEANDNGYGPYHKGIHKEYDWYIDGNKNGIACELNDRS